jgi:nitroreductase
LIISGDLGGFTGTFFNFIVILPVYTHISRNMIFFGLEVKVSFLKRLYMMDVFETVRTVLAVRAYQGRSIPMDVVRKIVESAWLTGSSRNGQPWHFIVVEDQATLIKLGALARTGAYIAQAPLAIVVAMEKSQYAVSDVSRAIQSMILTAWSEGIGSNWVGFQNLEAVKPFLGIPPEVEVMAIVPFGYPVKKLGFGRKNRKPLAVVAHRERFGQPYE